MVPGHGWHLAYEHIDKTTQKDKYNTTEKCNFNPINCPAKGKTVKQEASQKSLRCSPPANSSSALLPACPCVPSGS